MEDKVLVDEKTRRYYGIEEKKKYWEEWKKSGRPKTAFCKEKGISTASFYRWSNIGSNIKKRDKGAGLYEVKVVGKEGEGLKNAIDVKMKLPNGTILKMKLVENNLLRLIKGLNDASAIIR